MPGPQVARVLPDESGIAKQFDYLIPPEFPPVGLGDKVRIQLHGRRVGGWVVDLDVEDVADRPLIPLSKWAGMGPSKELLELADWAAWRWAGRAAHFLATASPRRVVVQLPDAGSLRGGAPGQEATERFLRIAPATDRWPLIQEVVGEPSLILVPSQADATRLATRLKSAGVPTALFPDEWAAAAAGGRVVVGVRAAAWARIPDLASILVLDFHDQAYSSERSPTWNAVAVARERARRQAIPFVATSPCPPTGSVAPEALIRPPRADERQGWAPVEIVDLTESDPSKGLLGDALVRFLREPGRRAVILNRKGRVALLACARCGELQRCETCDSVVGLVGEELRCRRCERERPIVCLNCSSTTVKAIRRGVTRLAEELSALCGEPVLEVTGDSTSPPISRIVVGTEALLHRVRNDVAGVAFIEFDQELMAPRFFARDEALALLARASRLVGGRHRGGRVLVQTAWPDNDVLIGVQRALPDHGEPAELDRRRLLGLPPFLSIAVVSGPDAEHWIGRARLESKSVTASLAGDGRWLLRAPDSDSLCEALVGIPRGRNLRVAVDPVRI